MALSTRAKLRYTVAAGVLTLLATGGTTLLLLRRANASVGDAPALRIAEALLAVFLLLALVLAWFAHASLQDDLTVREEAEAALRASEAKFSGILAIAADAIISIDDRQTILHFNEGAERIFGWTAAEMLGQPLSVLIPERYRQGHAGHIRGFAASPDSARQMANRREIFALRRDGSEFPAEASISKLSEPDGKRLFTVLMRDVTERKQRELAQRELAQAGATLSQTLESTATQASAVQLAVPWLADGAILDLVSAGGGFSRVVARVSDGALDRALAAVARDVLGPDSPSRAIDILRLGRSELVPVVSDDWVEEQATDVAEFERLRALGMRSVMLLPLVAREHVVGVLTLFRVHAERAYTDLELRIGEELALRAAFALDNARLYETAQQATHERDHALGVVSHDLRNPISAIGMCARALLAALPEGETRGLVRTIVDSTELTQRMIRDLLDVASIEVGRLSVERRPEPLGPIVERARALFEGVAEERGIVLDAAVPSGIPAVMGDAERLVQLLANLLSNALKHTERGGRVSLEARRTDAGIEVAVRDSGTGIPQEELPKIFERYWTVRRKAPKGGTGLGLAISRGIVEAHGGRIWAESALGVGSVFRFTLPTAR